MWLMLSRPGGLSLRDTRVTRATIGLALAVTVLGAAAAVPLMGHGGLAPALLGLACGLLALASAGLAVFGWRQRPAL
jgi:hypothetical protein